MVHFLHFTMLFGALLVCFSMGFSPYPSSWFALRFPTLSLDSEHFRYTSLGFPSPLRWQVFAIATVKPCSTFTSITLALHTTISLPSSKVGISLKFWRSSIFQPSESHDKLIQHSPYYKPNIGHFSSFPWPQITEKLNRYRYTRTHFTRLFMLLFH